MAPHDAPRPDVLDQAQLEHDIQVTRARLGQTVEQLSEKFDMRRQAQRHRQHLFLAGSVVALLAAVAVTWRRTH